MFLNSTFSSIEADAHRQHLLDQAEHHRLVKLVRAGTRVTRVVTPPPSPPSDLPEQLPPNHDENRRYAVSR